MPKFGALTFPAPIPAIGASLDPAIDVVADAFQAVLMVWINDAWLSVAPNEPFVKTIVKADPETMSAFNEQDLPALYVFSKTSGSKQITDSTQETEANISLLWVEPPGQYGVEAARRPVFLLFADAIAALVRKQRHPSYVHADDQGALPTDNPARRAEMLAAQTYGTTVPDKAGFTHWEQPMRDACIATHITVHQGEKSIRYNAFLAHVIACKWLVDDDPAQDGFVPTAMQQTMTTGGEDPLEMFSFDVPAAP